ncbi:MAG: leucine-rich repeat protein, partial [Rhodococcus sp.]|nr:leucine-rich repeat protein [Rhodococcus sp. (in: high G+C Gram-positive bacteria)]
GTTRTFSGTPQATDMGTVTVRVTADDSNGGTVSDDFDIEVRGVCERTERGRFVIVRGVPGISNCADVTSAHLAAIAELNLSLANYSIDAAPPISTLRSGDFAGLTGLLELDFAANSTKASGRIMTLPADIFDGLIVLEGLTLNNNNIPSLPVGIFDDLTALRNLELDNAHIGTVPANVFDNLRNLERLILDFTASTLPAGIFDGLDALTRLAIDGNANLGLTSIRSDIFDDLTALEELLLSDHSRLTTLPSDLFDSLTNLNRLTVSNLAISNLPADIFDSLTGLNELRIFGQENIESLPAGIFHNLTGLTTLQISGMNLQTLPDDLFEALTGLQILAFHENPGTADFVPTALAGDDRAVTPGTAVTLDASASGGAWGTNVTYAWTQQSGTTVTLTGADTATPGFTAPAAPGELEFQLSVTGVSCGFACSQAVGQPSVLRSTDTIRVTVIPGVTLALTPTSIRESDDPATTGVEEHRTRVTATLDDTSRVDTTVTVSVVPVAPAVAGDFMLSDNKVLTIRAGQTSSTGEVTIAAVDNATDAPDKQVTVKGEAENSIGVTGPADVTLALRDDEGPPLVTLVLADDEIHEVDDSDTTAVEPTSTTISATLSHPSTAATTVTIAPIANVLSVTGGTLTIPAGQPASTGSAMLTAIDNLDFAVRPASVSGMAVNQMGVRGPLPVPLTILDDEE